MKVNVNNKKIEVKLCKNIVDKTIGLMGQSNIKKGIVLVHCNSIHTFFMKEEIDVIMTDKTYNIIKIYKNVNKNKIIWPKKHVYYTFELPKNSISSLNINTKLKIEE